jgi:uncharacterized protein YciI
MRLLLTLSIIFATVLSATAQNQNPNYDADLAKKLGADDYGMKSFVFVILKTGSNESTDQSFRDSCFSGHLSNIRRLVEAKKLIVAGPMGKNNDNVRGIFIFDVPTIAEATDLLKTDPAVNEDFLKPLLFEWYGSAALAEYLPASDKIWKINP